MKPGNVLLTSAIALAVGYFAGATFGGQLSAGDFLLGNVGAAQTHSTISRDIETFEDRIANDSSFRKETQVSLKFIEARAEGMLAAAKISREAIKGIKGMSEYDEVLAELEKFASSAVMNSKEALSKLALVAEGRSDGGYENAANRAVVSFTMSDQCVGFIHKYIAAVDKYLEDKPLKDNERLAFSRDQWVAYDVTTSTLNADNSYNKEYLLSSEELLRLADGYADIDPLCNHAVASMVNKFKDKLAKDHKSETDILAENNGNTQDTTNALSSLKNDICSTVVPGENIFPRDKSMKKLGTEVDNI
ncbi:MAG: hypothetical protein HUK08_03440 [Bacteroidaceae bacterium]|nr:hypothetical protein [Bacteroidaceae bacterium]